MGGHDLRNLKKNTHTLTEGSIWKGILLFALPLLGSSLIQHLYSTVDLIFVGQLLGTKASAAIGASGLIVTCLIGFFNGMAVGTNVFAARYFLQSFIHGWDRLNVFFCWRYVICESIW